MRKSRGVILFLLAPILGVSQNRIETLTVEKIMRDPKWIGSSPSSPQWSPDSRSLYFNWNPDKADSDSLYLVQPGKKTAVKASVDQKQNLVTAGMLQYNKSRSACVYQKDGDIFYLDLKTGATRRITETTEVETNPVFSFNDRKIVYNRSLNLYAWNITTGEIQQLTNIRTTPRGTGPTRGNTTASASSSATEPANLQEAWLKKDQLQYFEILRTRKEKRDKTEAYTKETKRKELRSISIDDKVLLGPGISPDGRFINYRLSKPPTGNKTTIVPNYVTETGFTVDIAARTKVGELQSGQEYYLFDTEKDTILSLKTDSIPGIMDRPDFLRDYPKPDTAQAKTNKVRPVSFGGTYWSGNGTFAIIEVYSLDNKDRWLMLWDRASLQWRLLDRQRNEAWIGGPGSFGNIGWIDESNCWFQSEATGYSHIYLADIMTNKKKALTTGDYEVQRVQLSADKKYFYISTNEVHPGEQHFYRLNIANGKKERITSQTGAHVVSLSPDEKQLAILYSYSNKPWELYLQENKPNAIPEQITFKAQSEEFKTYAWRDPELITFPAKDGATVYARLYKPARPHPGKPAVLFVHGAGYLQNAHRWWSQYFREYMFNNLLADNGYYVMDIDYRGSAGYGRDWRTGIYRHMGGKDLTDHIDAVDYLVKNHGVDPKHVGLYGGSYGGFITLMGMFTTPDVFAAGAALRPVTDWANYNHPYTSNILNEPFNDSIAYRRSSPLYFAEGLKGDLLICHGMVDVNVHYQDAVKLAQRLIELGKDNWELAAYPMEDHAFVEPSSWTDEYKRIFKLFERVLKK